MTILEYFSGEVENLLKEPPNPNLGLILRLHSSLGYRPFAPDTRIPTTLTKEYLYREEGQDH
jgi:hypothetical protein